MITLTESAIKAVGRFISSSDKPTGGLRIEVTDGAVPAYRTACAWKRKKTKPIP
ncbi:hypothetical protein [Methylomonas koyamae]|uniref:hypothetical protein n=1 Tax=Methylomonas koyamae TaxID=702114 RepID=UPI000A8D31C0|nr:hypothetical protein [Methylomonas koyamae]